jgi:DNA (cytosine-5)-methyltransferase 1
MPNKLNYIDLFAGAGGLSEGFIRAGFEPVAHVEMDVAACYTLKTRVAYHYLKSKKKLDKYIAYLKGEINRQELYDLIPTHILNSVINKPIGYENNEEIFSRIDEQLEGKEVDLIIGGPPCQAYSLVGRARRKDGMKHDPRNYLFIHYARYLKKYNPKMFVFENVLGLRSADEGKYFKRMLDAFKSVGYEVKDYLFDAKNYGVLQNRKRVILIGYKSNLELKLPDVFKPIDSAYKVSNIFADLPKLQAGEGDGKYVKYRKAANKYLEESGIRNGIEIITQHVCRPHTEHDKEIYRIAVKKWDSKQERLNYNDLPERLKTHENRTSFFDRFKVVAADLNFCQTIVAHIAKDGHYYIHPDLEQNRSISIREAARLQSFPDDFYFEGVKENKNRTASFKQIGNAVPPLMAFAIAKNLRKIYEKVLV